MFCSKCGKVKLIGKYKSVGFCASCFQSGSVLAKSWKVELRNDSVESFLLKQWDEVPNYYLNKDELKEALQVLTDEGCPVELLDLASEHPDESVRYAAIVHDNASIETIREHLSDVSDIVSDASYNRLKGMGEEIIDLRDSITF